MQQKIGDEAVEAFFLEHERFSHEAEYRFICVAEGHSPRTNPLNARPVTDDCYGSVSTDRSCASYGCTRALS